MSFIWRKKNTQRGQQLRAGAHSTVEMHQGLWEFWHSSLVKNITDNKIWKSIPGGGGKLSGGEGEKTGMAGVCGRASIGCRARLWFPASAMSTLSPRSSSGLRRSAAAAAHRAIGRRAARWGSPSEQELPSPPLPPPSLPEPFQLYNTWNLRTRHRRPAPDHSVTAI